MFSGLCRAWPAASAAALACLVLLASPAGAAEGFRQLMPLLVDLPGWQAERADGSSMEISGQTMTTAQRDYEQGDKGVHAQIMTGAPAEAQIAASSGLNTMKFETTEERITTEEMDGFPVTHSYTFADKAGTVLVMLGKGSLFAFTFENLPEEEAMALARKFDWKAMKAATVK
ncbi:MAG TPA: hypothetical protein VEB64_08870 [Azospirillaceae bacterium]|nr:hypothetical protein [Azospirillaceae bacterium]